MRKILLAQVCNPIRSIVAHDPSIEVGLVVADYVVRDTLLLSTVGK